MSFNQNAQGRVFNHSFLLAEENCGRETAQIAADHAQVVTLESGAKIVPAGAVVPANDATAKGILYEDVEVTTGDMPGSIVTRGTVYADRLPAEVASVAKSALTAIRFIDKAPEVTRPDFNGTGA